MAAERNYQSPETTPGIEVVLTDLARDGLGTSVLVSNRHNPEIANTTPLITTNFVNGGNLLPSPYGDMYLGQLGVIAAGEGEATVTFTLLPGLLDYFRSIGLVSERTHVFEVNHQGGSRRHGYPHGDALEQLIKTPTQQWLSFNPNAFTLVPTLTGPHVKQQARDLGVRVLEQPSSDLTNNKAVLRQVKEKYGFTMLPGMALEHEEHLRTAVRQYGDTQHGIWLKFPTGSGGDLVRHVPQVTEDSIRVAISKLRETILQAHEEGALGMSGEQFWPEGKLAPEKYPLVIEEDAKDFGEVVIIGSNHFRTAPDGTQIYGYFRQITGEETGEFIGSERFVPDAAIQTALDTATQNVADFLRDNGYYAIAGIDYFVVKKPNGALQVYVLELNARPIISTYPFIVGERLGINKWVNINVTLPTAVSSMEEFGEIVGDDLYKRGAANGIVPMAFRTVVGDTDEGTLASPHCKLVILGDEKEQYAIIARLVAKGVKIGQTE